MQVSELSAGGGRHAQRSSCPVSCSLDLLGDRWTLLVMRDLLRGKTRYGDFLASGEGIPTTILADRLSSGSRKRASSRVLPIAVIHGARTTT